METAGIEPASRISAEDGEAEPDLSAEWLAEFASEKRHKLDAEDLG